jgi:crossover junction endodeoxyribonuclease RuvC
MAAWSMNSVMRILGIDPGLQLTGYGCLERGARVDAPSLIEAGVLRLKTRATLAFRLAQLKDDLDALLTELKPDVMVVEKLFSHYRHARTAIIMGHARGVVLVAGESRGIQLQELAATEVKRAVTGHGHATKSQVQHAVMQQCGLRRLPQPPDVADAIAIALCAARRMGN